VTTLTPATSPAPSGYNGVNPPVMPRDDGTYPYDGGPNSTVPAPQANPAPMKEQPQRTVPLEGRSVSLPKATKKWIYPAYGETARRVPAEDRTYYTKTDVKNRNAR
jgi:hypothetical protein